MEVLVLAGPRDVAHRGGPGLGEGEPAVQPGAAEVLANAVVREGPGGVHGAVVVQVPGMRGRVAALVGLLRAYRLVDPHVAESVAKLREDLGAG